MTSDKFREVAGKAVKDLCDAVDAVVATLSGAESSQITAMRESIAKAVSGCITDGYENPKLDLICEPVSTLEGELNPDTKP